jgi:hypothetical protein
VTAAATARSLSVLAIAVALVSPACGGGGEERVEPGAWARDVCTSFGRWRQRLADRSRVLETDVAAARDRPAVVSGEVARFLDDVVAMTNSLAADVGRAGTPDLEDGEALAADFRVGVADIAGVFAQARKEVEGMSPRRRALRRKLAAITTTTAQQVGAVRGVFEALEEKYDAPEIERVFAEDDACETFTS